LLAIAALLLLSSCEGVFRSDPFSGPIPDELSDLNGKALAELANITQGDSVLRIALISDSHYDTDALQKALLDIAGKEIDLIVHGGDLTQSGVYQEYLSAASLLAHATAPVLTLIGNHDHLAFGEELFHDFFGEVNISLVLKGVPIILWDNTVWENDEGGPDTKWLKDILSSSDRYAIVFAHSPPWDEQLAETFGNLYRSSMLNYNVLLSVHGHKHDPSFSYPFNDGMPYLVAGSTMNGYWQEIEVIPYQGQFTITQHAY
jgi:predicted phosphodiesterase